MGKFTEAIAGDSPLSIPLTFKIIASLIRVRLYTLVNPAFIRLKNILPGVLDGGTSSSYSTDEFLNRRSFTFNESVASRTISWRNFFFTALKGTYLSR